MSDLLAAAAVIAPFVSTAAASMAGAVIDSARDRLADSAVEGGRRLLGAALRLHDDDLDRSEENVDAVSAIEQLSQEQRQILENAIGTWLADGGELDAPSLSHSIRAADRAHRAGDLTHVTSYGNNSPAIGRIESATFTFHREPGGEAG
ncbi:hypothetical protein [Streptomyces cyaneofuscatus]|uniref:hypothetical protein n=1 Tax=Streptomyces cyaneofuscatus TaxID=66883 RepID=UPI00379638A0|nr:hypothetical protein OG973_06695 [Streptomyces cyaneofuscatus]